MKRAEKFESQKAPGSMVNDLANLRKLKLNLAMEIVQGKGDFNPRISKWPSPADSRYPCTWSWWVGKAVKIWRMFGNLGNLRQPYPLSSPQLHLMTPLLLQRHTEDSLSRKCNRATLNGEGGEGTRKPWRQEFWKEKEVRNVRLQTLFLSSLLEHWPLIYTL